MIDEAARWLADAESTAAGASQFGSATLRSIESVAVIGAGTMGSGIAIAALEAGYDVALLDQDAGSLERGVGRIREHYQRRVAGGKCTADHASATESHLSAAGDWRSLECVDLVIEAVFEDLDVKREVFRQLDEVARAGAILATNTSYLDVDAIAQVTSRPQDVIGLHFFSPAHVMRLVEVVRGASSSPDALATGVEVAKRLNKLPVVTGNAFGFVGNRIFAAYRRQCEFMLEEGASPEQIDTALEAFGFAMGPFAVADLSGLDIAWRMRQCQAAARDPHARYAHVPDLLCEAGRLGRKTGAGYYAYETTNGKLHKRPDPFVDKLIEAARDAEGLVPRSIDAAEIQRRALAVMANEAALLLAEGVAARASDVDAVLVNGYGFPRRDGGPVFWARARGMDALTADVEWLAALSGPGFVRGDLSQLFETAIQPAETT